MKQIAFDAVAFAQFAEWAALDRKLHQRIARLRPKLRERLLKEQVSQSHLRQILLVVGHGELQTSIAWYIKLTTSKSLFYHAEVITNKNGFLNS